MVICGFELQYIDSVIEMFAEYHWSISNIRRNRLVHSLNGNWDIDSCDEQTTAVKGDNSLERQKIEFTFSASLYVSI